MAAFSQATLIQRIRTILNDNPYIDACVEAMDASEVGLDVTDGTKYAAGIIVEFQTDGEQCLVTSVATNTLTVIRGYNGTTAATHSINALMALDPVFSYMAITDAIAACIRGLWPHVYKLVAESVTPVTTGNRYYDLAAGSVLMKEISSAYQIIGTGATSTVFAYGVHRGAYPIDLMFNMPTSKVSSGIAYYIPFLKATDTVILVNGITEITATVGSGLYSDLLEGIQVDCVTYLAAARLIAATDISRTTQEDISMGDATVVPLRRTSLAQYWLSKGIDERFKWQQQLKITLPRRQVFGHR